MLSPQRSQNDVLRIFSLYGGVDEQDTDAEQENDE
jgi:hypothetical protein